MSQSSLPAGPLAPGREQVGERPESDWERHAPLRLTVARGTLGLELYEPIEVGPLEVKALSLTLPGLRFPVDLSGGVPLFRNRRGELEHVELSFSLDGLGRLLDQRLRDLVGPLERKVSVWSVPDGLGIGLVGEGALAFDVLWAPDRGNARLVVSNARGAGLRAPALGYALRALDSAFGNLARRRGRLVTIEDVGQRLGRELLPALGARAPAAERLRLGELAVDGDAVKLELDSTFPPPALSDAAARALELAELVADGDDELARGEIERARALYIGALEQAPRHPELVRLVAEIDMVVGNRAEAALGLISESLPAIRAGLVGAELLARVGDLEAAREAVSEVARGEVFGALSALYFYRLAELEPSLKNKLELLGQALSRAPGLARVRWARFAARLEHGDVTGALSDVEHLEAGAVGARARHDACRRAARSLLDSGFGRDAGWVFERALRYLPDDPVATAGLARSLIETGRSERALALFERAIQLGERKGRADPDALVDLGRLLAERLRDLPQAIARVRQVPASSERAVEARGLEARWRAALGDIVGATQAWGRLREVIELSHPADPRWAAWLLEAAEFERGQQKDVISAERHLAVAIRIAPHDRAAAEAYREVAAVVAAQARLERESRTASSDADAAESVPPEPPRGS